MQDAGSASEAKAPGSLHDGWFGALSALFGAAGPSLGEPWSGIGKAFAGPAGMEAALNRLSGGLTSSIAELSKPLAINAERAWGGLADAFGLAPMREFDAAGRELAGAALAQWRAQAEYLDLTLDAWRQGRDALMNRLNDMGRRGESVDTMLALTRLCARTMDGAMHQAMQSPRALQVSADAIRAGLRARQQQQRIVALATQALNVPTRSEVDEAFREIQDLKRELRRLRKSAPGASEARQEVVRAAAPPKTRKRTAPPLKNGNAAAA